MSPGEDDESAAMASPGDDEQTKMRIVEEVLRREILAREREMSRISLEELAIPQREEHFSIDINTTVEVVRHVVDMAVSGLIGAWVVSAQGSLVRRIVRRSPPSPLDPLVVQAAARWAINEVFSGVLSPADEPISETIGMDAWSVMFQKAPYRYVATKTKRSTKAEVQRQRIL